MEVRDSGVMECDVGPVVVHCSAGVGRSGVFAATDVALSWLERGRSFEELDIRALLLLMRKQRLGLVQSPEQLRFVYAAVLTAAHDLLGHGQSIRDLEMAVKSYGTEMERTRVSNCPVIKDALPHHFPSLCRIFHRILHCHHHVLYLMLLYPPRYPLLPLQAFLLFCLTLDRRHAHVLSRHPHFHILCLLFPT